MKAYVAAPIFTPPQLAVVKTTHFILEQNGFEVFNPYEASRGIWNGRKPADCTAEERQQVLEGNVKNLDFPTEMLVAWVGGTENGKTDTGVAWEMGHFFRRRVADHQPAYTIAYIDPSDVRQSMNLMLAGTVDAVVRGHSELSAALDDYLSGGPARLRENFRPDRHVQHEQDPIR